MLFTESHNGACPNSMTYFRGIRQSIPSQADLSLIRIFNLKHKSRFMDTSDNNLSLIRREFFTGFYGIFQGIGKADGKFRRINGERFGNRKMEIDCNARSFCLTKVRSERGI